MTALTDVHVLITGGAGFIGSHLTEDLLSLGAKVTVVDNLSTGKRANLPTHPHLRLLVKDINTCQPQDFEHPVHKIVHLAATPSVATSWQAPLTAHHQNLSSTLAVIQLCEALAVSGLVFASSAAVYGNLQYQPVGEDHPTCPISPYGLQKLASEQYAQLFAPQLGFTFVGLRLFNVYGIRQDPHSPYSGVISIFADAMRQGQAIMLYGTGAQTRDFIFVKDVSLGIIQALTLAQLPGAALIFNLGTGQAISLLTLVQELQTCFPQWPCEIYWEPARPGDIQHSQANIAQAKAQLQFAPQWSLQAGLRHWVNAMR
ncbi:NAD-dependent epimerase/dehydratase family protein [Synechococcales cyanobacterium C]|uniref:UDP-glucose 4-epimerase n=1 Tax=Petrachloros mirabilis ULC683 TaxID=2781853 RepID=A0A8K2AGX0_9CYAN|nr:NAD-dependent epimerase/dehydratase family protein [Petrachloros mirabilis]NCJ05504.1 NAD-dependent epimerase/dehydratase family protein [Petrachloros mirabilis ULC683]